MTTTTTTTTTGTYQMLWDCPSCGTKKLLGVDHRHCPNCGAPQEENLRYFPSQEDRVPTEFRGSEPDWECRHCGTPNGSLALHCAGCGAPRGDAATVFVRESIAADRGETGEQAQREWKERQAARRAERRGDHEPVDAASGWRGRLAAFVAWIRERPWRLIWVALPLALVSLISLAVCDRQVALAVTGHAWTRVIPVERYTTLDESAWCDSTPADARIRSRSREIHHHDKVPDGEDCRTVPGSCSNSCRNVDNGNGSFSEVCTQTCTADRTECTTRYRDVPVYADKCYYEVDRWVVVREARAEGDDLEPYWPAPPSFSGCTSTALGCERLGPPYGVYVVRYRSDDPDEPERFECPREESSWQATAVGARYLGEVSRLGGELDCDTLVPVDAP